MEADKLEFYIIYNEMLFKMKFVIGIEINKTTKQIMWEEKKKLLF